MGIKGIHKILDLMDACLSSPRTDKAASLPATGSVPVSAPHQRARLLGPGGLHLRRIESETGARFTASDDGASFSVFAPNPSALREAEEMAAELIDDDPSAPDPEMGAIVTVKILEVRERSVSVEMRRGAPPVTIPVSQMSAQKVNIKIAFL